MVLRCFLESVHDCLEWLSRAVSDFLFFWGPFGVPLGTFGVPLCLSGSLWVPLGSPWSALGPSFGRCGSLWHPLGVALGSLWGTSGVSLVALGSLGLPEAAGGYPKCLKTKNHTFLCVFAHVYKSTCFLRVSRGGQGSMQQNTRVFVCFRISEAEVAPNQNIRIFVCFRGPVF